MASIICGYIPVVTGRVVGCGSRVVPYDHLIVVYRGFVLLCYNS